MLFTPRQAKKINKMAEKNRKTYIVIQKPLKIYKKYCN